MLASITPLGERGRGQRFGLTAAAYLLGSALGGVLVGGVLGGVGSLALGGVGSALRAGLLAGAAVVAAVVDARKLPIPCWHRQVNEDWLAEFRGWVYGAGFGFQLGLGVATIVTTASIYLMWLAALLVASPAGGALIGLSFGVARAVPLLAGAAVRRPEQVADRVRRVDGWDGSFRRMTVGVEAVAATAFLLAGLAVG
jgi:MFS family permease